MRYVFSFICFLVFVIVMKCMDGNPVCNNVNCEFEQLQPPLILVSKSADIIVIKDSKNKLWTSSTIEKIAKSILVEGYQIGDTIGKK